MANTVKKMGHLVVSVVIALILFFYATTTNYKNSLSVTKNTATETYTHTISNVPVDIRYDSDKYFISGFSSTVAVDLIGSNRLILQKETDEATRSFSVVADLTNLKEKTGTVQAQLQVQGLPTGVNAVLSPVSMQVRIGKRTSKTLPVIGTILQTQLAPGYSIGKVKINVANVKVTSDEETLSRIDHVEAVVADAIELSSDYEGIATLQAVDSEGTILPVVFSEEVTGIQATIIKNK